MQRTPFRYIFPIASFAIAVLLVSVSSWLASRDRARERVGDGVGWDYEDLESPSLAEEFVAAMYLPAAVAVAPLLVAGSYLDQVYPIDGKQIEIFSLVIIALAGFLQWYWIGWLLEGQMGYRLASTNRVFSKRKRFLNSLAIAIAACLGLLGAFIAFEAGEMHGGIISVIWACFAVTGLIRWRRAQDDPSPKTTQLSLR
ncbi:MAG: hypothetical protein ABSC10_00295 [Candidatus Acidiferrales bacterium]|jgi:hypothetical protein